MQFKRMLTFVLVLVALGVAAGAFAQTGPGAGGNANGPGGNASGPGGNANGPGGEASGPAGSGGGPGSEPSSGCPSVAPGTLAGTAYPPGTRPYISGLSPRPAAGVVIAPPPRAPTVTATTPAPAPGSVVVVTPPGSSTTVVTPGPPVGTSGPPAVVATAPPPGVVVPPPPAEAAHPGPDHGTMSPIEGNASAGLASGMGAAWDSHFDTGTPTPIGRGGVNRNLC
jgi:hypothetical protein